MLHKALRHVNCHLCLNLRMFLLQDFVLNFYVMLYIHFAGSENAICQGLENVYLRPRYRLWALILTANLALLLRSLTSNSNFTCPKLNSLYPTQLCFNPNSSYSGKMAPPFTQRIKPKIFRE